MTEQEFTAIVKQTKGTVLSAVGKHLAARFSFAIDDVVQETYLRGYRHLAAGRFRGDSSVESWLYAIARNESLRMNERLAREEKKQERLSRDLREAPAADDLIAQAREILSLVERLPQKYRQVVSLKAEGASEVEIAHRLDISIGTVKSRFSRGKEMLRTLMSEVE